MQCMEVWGGNAPADRGVAMAGLDAWVYSKPFMGAAGGGDVYYVSSCATGRIVRLLVADVSGHGQAVSDAAVQLRSLMRQYVNHLDQSRFVKSLNEQFAGMARAGNFATAVVTTYFAPTSRLTLCNAGHPPPLLYRADSKRWTFLQDSRPQTSAEPANLPLGILELADYPCFDIRLGVGDLALCYSDALIEAQLKGGELLGSEGLLSTVEELGPPDPSTLIGRLLEAISNRASLSGDDVTLLLFGPNRQGRRVPIRDRLLGPVRVMGAIARSIANRGQPIPWPDLKIANIGGALLTPFERLWSSPDSADPRGSER